MALALRNNYLIRNFSMRSTGKTSGAPALGKWLRKVRIDNDMQQDEFAMHIGVSRPLISMMERGERAIMLETIAAVMSAFPGSPPAPLGDEVTMLGQVNSDDRLAMIPYAGVVPCGKDWGDPLQAQEKRPVEPKFGGRNRFMTTMDGDSCWPALQQGDLLIWEHDQAPAYSLIVLAEREDDRACTAKQLVRLPNGKADLKPVNPSAKAPEIGPDWRASARLVGVIRPGDVEKTWYNAAGLRPDHLMDSYSVGTASSRVTTGKKK